MTFAKKMEEEINWSRCIICQKAPLIGVLTNTKNKKGNSDEQHLQRFKNLYDNLHKLWDAVVPLPKVLLPKTLTAQTMFEKSALWHTCCWMEYTDERTERLLAQHKKENPPQPEPEPEKQAPKRSQTNFQNALCIFCQRETNEYLFNVRQLNWGIEHLKMAQGTQ